MTPEPICIGIPNLGWISWRLAASITKLLKAAEHPQSRYKFSLCWVQGARPADYARNLIVQKFLASPCTRLWFMDADTGPPDNIIELLTMDADIVSGITPTWGNHDSGEQERPNYTVYKYDRTQRGLVHAPTYEKGSEYVDAVGTAMMLIRRHVLEDHRMRLAGSYVTFDGFAEELGDDEAPAIFREIRKPNGQLNMSEDLDFCWRARKLGYLVAVNHGVKCHHIKEVDVLSIIDFGLMMYNNGKPASSGQANDSSGRETHQEAVLHASGD